MGWNRDSVGGEGGLRGACMRWDAVQDTLASMEADEYRKICGASRRRAGRLWSCVFAEGEEETGGCSALARLRALGRRFRLRSCCDLGEGRQQCLCVGVGVRSLASSTHIL